MKLVIIPTYNEKDTIHHLIANIFDMCPGVNILVVDDNSPDGTGSIVDALSGEDRRIHCLHREKKEGIGPAYVAGFKWAIDAGYEYIAQMDADFSHRPEYLPGLFELAEEYDLVIGSRYVPGGGVEDWGFLRKMVSRGGSLYSRIVLRIPVNDLTGGFKCFKRGMLEKINLDGIRSKGYVFQIETTYRAFLAGAKIKEMPIVFPDRRVGKTKMTSEIFLEAMFAVIELALNKNKRG